MRFKTAFRYQSKIRELIKQACDDLRDYDRSIRLIQIRYKDGVEIRRSDVTNKTLPAKFVSNDTVIKFAVWLIEESTRLSTLIDDKKRETEFHMDVAVQQNKYIQQLVPAIKNMVKYIGYDVGEQTTKQGHTLKTCYKEIYDRNYAKSEIARLSELSESNSDQIESAYFWCTIDYTAPFDINGTYEDILWSFSEKLRKGKI